MAGRSITATVSNKLNVIAKNLEKAPKPAKITFGKKKTGFNTEGIESRLPAAYFKWKRQPNTPPPQIYWDEPKSDWRKHPETGERLRTNRVPMKVQYPKTSQLGLWSGEGLVLGYRKSNKEDGVRVRKTWKPFLFKKDLYSEILDRTFTIEVTLRTLDLIDEAYGFDYYILKTLPEVMNSLLGMKLKRHLLMRLADRGQVYPDDPAKAEKIYERYKEFVIPMEEAEWVGLTRSEAIAKQRRIEEKQFAVRSLLDVYTEELVNKLKETQLDSKEFELSEELERRSKPLVDRILGRSTRKQDDTPTT